MRSYIILLIFITVTSCSAPELRRLYLNDFNYPKFKNSNLYIPPIVNSTKQKNLKHADAYIESIIRKERKKVGVIGAHEFAGIIDKNNFKDKYKQIRKKYKEGKIEDSDIKKLSSVLEPGYIVLSHIYFFHTHEYKESETVWIEDKKGETERATERSYNVKSTIKGGLTIYDIDSGKSVFHADHEVSRINTSTYTERNFFDYCIYTIIEAVFPTTPYGATEVVEILYYEIIENIPEK